jgi:hypothetical protein
MRIFRDVDALKPRPPSLAICLQALLLTTLVGCASTHNNLARSADKLEHNAYVLGRDAREANYGSDPGYAHSAQDLSLDTRRLREALSDKSADDSVVKAAFERVSYSYHVLRENVERSDSLGARTELRQVTEAYLDVERGVGSYDGRRYAQSGNRKSDEY